MDNNIQFRELNINDMNQLYIWLNNPEVKKWYGKKDVTQDDVTDEYSDYIGDGDPTAAYIIVIDGIEAGYIQTYFIDNYPEYNKHVGADPNSAGLDLFIGESEYLHKGYGSMIINRFLEEVIFSNPLVDKCILGPEPKNICAIKTYEKCGFKWYKTIEIPDEDEPEYLMVKYKNKDRATADRA